MVNKDVIAGVSPLEQAQQAPPYQTAKNVLTGFNQEEREKVNDAQWEINLEVSQEIDRQRERERCREIRRKPRERMGRRRRSETQGVDNLLFTLEPTQTIRCEPSLNQFQIIYSEKSLSGMCDRTLKPLTSTMQVVFCYPGGGEALCVRLVNIRSENIRQKGVVLCFGNNVGGKEREREGGRVQRGWH